MKTFKTFKAYIVKNAKLKNACKDQLKKALESSNYQELLKVITDNAGWCYRAELVDDVILSSVPDRELKKANIYVNKKDVIQYDGLAYYYSSTSKHYGSSTSKHYGSSTSEHYDSSKSEHYGSSKSKHYGSSTSEHYDSSKSKHYDSSTSEHYDSSTSKHYDSSTSEHYDSSKSKHYDSSYASVYTLGIRKLKDKVIIRERESGKVYFKKDAFTIVQSS